MMSHFSASFHNVTKVELLNTYVDNDNQRTLRVTDNQGQTFEVTFFGASAGAFDAFPRADDFRRSSSERPTEFSEAYRDFLIQPSTVSYMTETDWSFRHKDYDGAPDGKDDRYRHGTSIEDCKRQIDEWHAENSEEAA